METAADLIFEKRNKSCEIVIILFEYCNFACTFCPQDHSSTVGMSYDEIVSKAAPVVEYMKNNKFATEFVIRLIGGEPFNDDIPLDDLIPAYQDFMDYVRYHMATDDRPIDFIWITNLSMEKRWEQVKQFLERNSSDTQLVVSYDLKGRFNTKTRVIFEQNIHRFASHIHNINTVMTRQNIEALLAGDEFFDWLYDHFDYSWDMYIKGHKSDYASPYESQVLELLKLFADKYPEIEFIRPFLKKPEEGAVHHGICSRGNGYAMDPEGNVISEGCVGTHYLTKINDPLVTRSNRPFLDSTIEDFLEKYNCHSCEFYQRCPMACFAGIKTGNMIPDLNVCVNKEVFRYVDSKT